MKDLTAELVDFALTLRLDDVPPSVVAAAKRHILDTLVVARPAADAEGVEPMLRWAQAESVAGTATVWSHDCRLRPGHAAFVNALAAAALEFDTLCLSVHADNVIVPAAFAIAEDRRANGESFLCACIAGTEIMARLAHASIPPQKGWNHTAVYGVFGAALAVARLAGLTAEQAANAFGICLSLAAGTQQPNFEQCLTKRMQPAFAARNGIFAVEAAQHGITGPHAAIDGKAGLSSLYQASNRERLLAGLGRDYVLLRTGIKKYPVCACSHAAIDACFALSGGKTLPCEDIEAIEVTLTPFMARLVGGAFEPAGNPVVTAQFSVGYALACVLLRGHVDLSDLAPEAIADERVASLARRVVVHVDPGAAGELAPATVRLETPSLGDRTRTIASMPGTAELPLTERAFDEKLAACDRINPFVSRLGGLAALKRGIEQIEKNDHMSGLAALMGARRASRIGSAPRLRQMRCIKRNPIVTGKRFEEQIVWVAGASGGLGKDIVAALAREGATVVASSRSIETTASSQPNVVHLNTDVRTFAGVRATAEIILRRFGRIDGLVSSLTLPVFGDFFELDDDAWDSVIETKLLGSIRLVKAVAPAMKAQGGGSIVALSGGGGINPSPRHLPGSVANAGINLAFKGLSKRLGPDRVRVNVVSPGPIESPRLEAIKQARGPSTMTILGSTGFPEDVTSAVLFLLSPEAKFISGANLAVDGGGRLHDPA